VRAVGAGAIRPYEARDRDAVRRICFQTGYMGDPVRWQWADAESFADLFTSWYTDREPESALVVEVDGEVAGYLLGCRDSRRLATPPALLARHVLLRGLLVRPGTAPLMWRGAADVGRSLIIGRVAPTVFDDPRWPAHLHIDLLPKARCAGIGRQLVTRWLDTLREEGIVGCHLETWAENDGAVAFFEAMGFRRRGEPVAMPGVRSPEGHRHHTQLMVRSLD
jgi:ribosomal protein S18 acetylase RimI-like enzyme